jgi:hypothetical protein
MDAVTLAALAAFPEQLEAHYGLISAEHKNWRPSSWEGIPSEPFTPVEQVWHVRDIEIDGYHERLRRTLQESHPLLASLDGEALAGQRSYATRDTAEAFAEFRLARSRTIDLVSNLNPRQFARPAVFEGRPVTLRGLVHNLCSHDQQHLAGLQLVVGKIIGA